MTSPTLVQAPRQTDIEAMTEAEIRILCECLGDHVRDLYRTHFLDEGEIDTREDDLTIVFRSGKTVRLTRAHPENQTEIW